MRDEPSGATIVAGLARLRVCDASNIVVGSGFLAGPHHVLTCAHVVNAALGRAEMDGEVPPAEARVSLDLPHIGLMGLASSVSAWFPPREGAALEAAPLSDIAVLELGAVPAISPYALAEQVPPDTPLRATGFPEGSDHGEDTRITAGLPTTYKWLAVDTGRNVGAFVRRGYSGGPAFVLRATIVAGMVVARDLNDRAYLIPHDLLAEALPLANRAAVPPALQWPMDEEMLVTLLRRLSPAPLHPALVPIGLIKATADVCRTDADAGLIILQVNNWLRSAGPIEGIELELPAASLPMLSHVGAIAYWLEAFNVAPRRGGPVLVALLAALPEGLSRPFRREILAICDEASGG